MNEWWLSRSPQDKLAFMAATIAVALLLLYLLVWLPFTQQVEKRRLQVDSQQATLDWMKQSIAQIEQLRERQSADSRQGRNEPLLTLVDRTAKSNQLRQFIQRLRPEGSTAVQIWVEQAPFDKLTQWLGLLVGRYGIKLESASIEQQDKPGLINAKLNLLRESA